MSIWSALARPLRTARNWPDGVSKVSTLVFGKKRFARSAICGLLRLAMVCLSWFRSAMDLIPLFLLTSTETPESMKPRVKATRTARSG